ncbi:MAG: NAD(P)H-dependent oxidoreductase [Candidatus Delongbacteria bacterium]|jgi:NAD(P)H dehydrogenase (quinone)|nr:NAD(P)H-dependent oxidoreductase [Candidatus Delongbacteria bacterium]
MNTLIINGNPDKNSFGAAMADRYMKGALDTNNNVKLIHLIDLDFDPILRFGYKKKQELEPDLKMVQDEINNSDHIVFIFPTWWSTYPAIFKGFIDRIFLPGFGFKFKKGSPMPDKLLKGKSARVIITMDGPALFYKWYMGSPGLNSFKKGVLGFCGIKPVKTTIFSSIKSKSEEKLKEMLNVVEKLGRKGA